MKKQISSILVLFVMAPLFSWAFGNGENIQIIDSQEDLFKGKFVKEKVLNEDEQAEAMKIMLDEKLLEEKIIEGIKSYKIEGGNSGGGGGDDLGLEFQRAMIQSVEKFRRLMPEEYETLKAYRLEDLAASAKVFVIDESLSVEASEYIQNSVAVNFPTANTIVVNRSRFLALKNPIVVEGIAFHEVLSLRKLERTGYYPYSAKFLALQGAQSAYFGRSQKVNFAEETSKFEILKNNFNEAHQPINIDVIKEFSKSSYVCTWVLKTLGATVESEPKNGYLWFIGSAERETTNQKTTFGPLLAPGQSQSAKSQKANFGIGAPGEVTDYAVLDSNSVSGTEYVIRTSLYDFIKDTTRVMTLRKNNGLLAFKWVEKTLTNRNQQTQVDHVYGYCYRKK